MNLIPSMILKQLYTRGSLRNDKQGIVFSIKNRLSDAKLTGLKSLLVGDKSIPLSDIFVDTGDAIIPATDITTSNAVDFPLRKKLKNRKGQAHGFETYFIPYKEMRGVLFTFEIRDVIWFIS